MTRTKHYTTYRLVTPPHMDVTVPFKQQDEAVTEAKKRGAWNRTMLFVQNLEGEWQLIYDSRDDQAVELKRLANKEYLEDTVDPSAHTMLRKIMGRNPIEYFKRRVDGGMRLVEVFITKDEDPLPFIRAILMSDKFVCWPLPGYTEKQYIKRLEPCGNDATHLFNNPPVQKELNFC